MQPLTFYLNARRLTREAAQALVVDDAAPEQPLRLALVIRGSERHVFPALALDDWGREKKGLSLYRWLYEEGPRFPRAELFGFDAQGAQTQIFLRDLELSFKYPCFVFAASDAPITEGRRLSAIFVPGEPDQSPPQEIDPPHNIPWALRRAAVRWRRQNMRALHNAGWHPR